ncbi:hypothetical protein FWH58_03245 [Candidatus Saccharibacteria bacterium]|nr:hypothetical protein [Candidatus Saccharibacteria bacterium]
MLQLNLLPDIKKELLHAKRMRNLVMTICIFVSIGAGGIVLLLSLFLGGLAIQKSLIAGEVDKHITEIEKEKTRNQLGEYISVQNDLNQISAIKENQPQLSRVMSYLDVIFGRTAPINGLHWTDWQNIKISTTLTNEGVSIELSGQVDTITSRLMLRNRLYYAMVKYSQYTADGSGVVVEGETKTDQKLFPNMIPTIDFEGGARDDTTGRWPFKAVLVFNPIMFKVNYRIQAIEVDSCKVWSATYGTIGEGCQDKTGLEDLLIDDELGGEPIDNPSGEVNQ